MCGIIIDEQYSITNDNYNCGKRKENLKWLLAVSGSVTWRPGRKQANLSWTLLFKLKTPSDIAISVSGKGWEAGVCVLMTDNMSEAVTPASDGWKPIVCVLNNLYYS